MSSVRSSVELLFGDIANYFKFIDFKKKLRIGDGKKKEKSRWNSKGDKARKGNQERDC